jgi:hypothetical protein
MVVNAEIGTVQAAEIFLCMVGASAVQGTGLF